MAMMPNHKILLAAPLLAFSLVACATLDKTPALLPPHINFLLAKVTPGMRKRDLDSILTSAYPACEPRGGRWSGQTGYFDYFLGEGMEISVSCIERNGEMSVHERPMIYVFFLQEKRRIGIELHEWSNPTDRTDAAGDSGGREE